MDLWRTEDYDCQTLNWSTGAEKFASTSCSSGLFRSARVTCLMSAKPGRGYGCFIGFCANRVSTVSPKYSNLIDVWSL